MCIKINSKWDKHLNMRTNIVDLVKYKVQMLQDICIGKIFLGRNTKVEETSKNLQMQLLPLKSFWTTKEIISRVYRQPIE
jgi:hypothetical protein